MTVAKILFHGKDWIHVDRSADSVNIDGKNYYPFVENPSGQYEISGAGSNDDSYVDIKFTISKDGKLTVDLAVGGSGSSSIPNTDLKIKKQPL